MNHYATLGPAGRSGDFRVYSTVVTIETTTNETNWTLGRLLSWTSAHFAGRDVDDARLSAEVLLAHAAGCRRIDLYTRFDEVLEAEPLDRFRSLVRRGAVHEPIAYLVGEKEFFSLSMIVTPDVLIPRAETETLVECVIDHCTQTGGCPMSSDVGNAIGGRRIESPRSKGPGPPRPKLLDLGTGGGCIAVAVLSNVSDARMVATDVSVAALDVARANAERHGVLDRLELLEVDRLALSRDVVPEGGFDVLMSNPPYIAADAMGEVDASVREYEPRAALTDEADGMSFYRAIAADGPALLASGGCVIVEAADGRARAVIDTIEQPGRFVHQATWKDRSVGQDRVLVFSLRS